MLGPQVIVLNSMNCVNKTKQPFLPLWIPYLPFPFFCQVRLLILDQPVVVATVSISDDVVEDDQPFKL